LILERYFRTKLAESEQYKEIGSWWELNRNLLFIVGRYVV